MVGLDINSLYPTAMSKFDMPTGNGYYLIKPQLTESTFGFFEASIECPDDMLYPTLPFREAENNIICPIGA